MMIAGLSMPPHRRSGSDYRPGRFQTAGIGARSRRRSHQGRTLQERIPFAIQFEGFGALSIWFSIYHFLGGYAKLCATHTLPPLIPHFSHSDWSSRLPNARCVDVFAVALSSCGLKQNRQAVLT